MNLKEAESTSRLYDNIFLAIVVAIVILTLWWAW